MNQSWMKFILGLRIAIYGAGLLAVIGTVLWKFFA